MSYRTSRVTPWPVASPFPASAGEFRVYYPYFVPASMDILISTNTGVVDDYMHYSNGSWDGTLQQVHSLYSDPVRGKGRSELVNNRIMSHYERGASPSYNPTEVIRGWYDHYDTTTQELVFMLEKSSSGYQINIRARS